VYILQLDVSVCVSFHILTEYEFEFTNLYNMFWIFFIKIGTFLKVLLLI